MRGAKPKPPGQSKRHPERFEGVTAKLPPCPPHLDDEARREWRRIGHRLLNAGLVTEIDRAALAAYCVAWSRWVDAEEQLRKYGVIVKGPGGMLAQSPLLSVANKAMEQMAKLLVEFGMSPSARSRVAVAPPVPVARPTVEPPAPGEDPREALRLVR